MQLTGAEIVIRCLQEEGVEYVFGYPGGAVLNIYDELFKQEKVKHVLVRHEQGAVHAADGYSRSSTKIGVCLVTSGPGVTNAVTGIATAYMDSIPMVVLTGQVPTHAIGQDAFQECDTVGITRPCVKHNFLVKEAKDIATTIKKAFYLGSDRAAGPVLVDIPKDVTQAKTEWSYPRRCRCARTTRDEGPLRPDQESGPAAARGEEADGLRRRRRDPERRGAAVDAARAPARLPLHQHADGARRVPRHRPAVHRHAGNARHLRVEHGDAELRRADRDRRALRRSRHRQSSHFFRADRKIIHIDIDPSSISKRVKVDVPIVGYVGDVLDEMLKIIESSPVRPDPVALKAWWSEIKDWQRKDCLKYDAKSDLIKPQYVIQKLYELTKGDAYVTSDVGQHQMWAAQYYKFDKPRRWINSGGLGTMGFGLPAAMGVKLVQPGRERRLRHGEASIQMCIQELSTCKQYHLPIKIVNLNNRYMGMVRQWQEFFYGNRYAESYMDALPDFVKLAEAYGHVGMKIEKPADVEGALREAMKLERSPRVHGLHHRSGGERVPDDRGGQGPDRDDPRGGTVSAAVGKDRRPRAAPRTPGAPLGGGRAAPSGGIMRHILSILVENEAGRSRAFRGSSPRAATTSSR
jgi:acetolactate synthase-1/2/3 large subunit